MVQEPKTKCVDLLKRTRMFHLTWAIYRLTKVVDMI